MLYTHIHASNDLPIYNIYKTTKIGLKYIKILLCQTNKKIKNILRKGSGLQYFVKC